MRKDPALVVRPQLFARAAAYGLAVTSLGGFLWAQVGSAFGLSWLLLMLLGYAVGEAVSRGANGKVSMGLVITAGGLTVLGAVLGRAVVLLARLPSGAPLDIKLGIALQYGLGGLFDSIFGLLFLVLAVMIATSRVR